MMSDRVTGRSLLRMRNSSSAYSLGNADRPLTKSLIIEHVWDIHFDSVSNVVEVHINSLRNKLDKGFTLALIHTVRGVGYVLTDTPS